MDTHTWLLIGCYTRKPNGGKGIYRCQLNTQNGAITPVGVFEELPNPSFLAFSHDKRHIFAVIETNDFAAKNSGGIASLQWHHETGQLSLLNSQPTQGADPCHVRVAPNDCVILVTNYDGQSAVVLPVRSEGNIQPVSQRFAYQGHGVQPQRQDCSHPHSTFFSPDYRYVYVADLGLDCLHAYQFDAHRTMLTATDWQAVKTPPGSGPRHLVAHPNRKWVYLINELSNTIIVYCYEPVTGKLYAQQITSTLPDDFHGENTAAELQILQNGRFLYASNRGHNSLAIFKIEPNGDLSCLGFQSTLGRGPRHFILTADDRLLLCANQDSGNVVSFFIDPQNGQLTPTGHQIDLGQPVCLLST